MIALFRKELAELSGTFGLALFAVLLVGWAHATIPLGLHNGEEVVRYLIEDITIIGSLAAFAAGHTRFGPEYQQQTLGFLDALPTSRTRIFLAKVITGFLPIALTALGIGLIKLWALNAHPLGNAISVIPLVALIALSTCALMAAHYTAGLVLSWFGEVGWQAMLVTGACMVMATIILPSLAHWYPLFAGVIHLQMVGGWPTVPLAPLVLWILWSMACVAVSWVLFLGPGDRIANGPWWVKGVAQVVVYTPPVGLLVLLVFLSTISSAISLPNLVRPTFRGETEHFRVLASEADRPAGEALIASAEEVRDKIRERFGVDGPERLDLELTGASEHLGGVFIAGKIQLRTDADAQTLAHELSHAWSHHLEAPSGDAEAWRFFEEGLATLNESVVAAPESQAAVPWFGSPSSDWFLAPVHGRRSQEFNPDEDYSVGRLWAEALVEVGGLEAAPCVIRAAGRTPRVKTDGIPWWSARLAECDVSLDDVVAAYEARLPHGSDPADGMIGWLTAKEGGAYVVHTSGAEPGTPIVCMARSSASESRTSYVAAFANQGEPCRLPTARLGRQHFQLAVGVMEGSSTRQGPWRTIRVP